MPKLLLDYYLLVSPPRLAPGAAGRFAGGRGRLCSNCSGINAAARLWGRVAAEHARPQEVFDGLQAGQGLDEDHIGGVVPELGLVRGARHAQLEGLRQG